jgi:hypothetical protein
MVQSQQVRSQGKATGAENVFSFGGVDVNVLQVPVDHIVEMMPGIAKEQWLNAYEKTLAALPSGVYLLSVHLGYNDDELQAMTYRR